MLTVLLYIHCGPLYLNPNRPLPSLILLENFITKKFVSSYLLFTRFNDLLLRCRELDTWTQDLALPAVVWLSGFFNPQSFLTGKGWGRVAPGADRAALLAEVQPGSLCATPPALLTSLSVAATTEEEEGQCHCKGHKMPSRRGAARWGGMGCGSPQ